ncbi:MAG: sulfotransferase domain-containing protein [Fulvivirga sp.]
MSGYQDILKKAGELANSGNHQKALSYYEEAAKKNWYCYDALQGWAGSLTWLGAFYEALQIYLRAAAAFPDRTPDYFVIKNRIKSKIISDNDKELLEYAIQCTTAIKNILQFNFYANDFLSELLMIKGDKESAIKAKYFSTICRAAHHKSHDLDKFNQKEGKLPDFIIIGPQKTATTALYSYLIQSPDIYPSINKELFFFNGPGFNNGLDWYKSYFPQGKNEVKVITGEATATYFNDFPKVAQRIYESIPKLKVIFTFRDPAKRAISDYYMKVRNGLEQRDLYTAVTDEIKFLSENKFQKGKPPKNFKKEGNMGYVFFGLYDYFLSNYTKHFPSQNLLVIRSEDLRQPQDTVNKVCNFLNATPPQLDIPKSVNKGEYPKDAAFHKTLKTLNEYYLNNKNLVGDYY